MPSDNKNKNVYVGHRYVPKIFGVWDKLKTYEGLSIVTWEGTSYTSKKRVPEGVDILNEEYWAVTGNYNAQVENYRQEVRDMQDEVDDSLNSVNQQLAQTSINVKSFGALGDGATDDAPAIRRAIAHLKDIGGGKLFFPKGKFYISSGDDRVSDAPHFPNATSPKPYIFETIDNLTVEGVGEESELIIESNMLGYNSNNGRGQVPTVFANRGFGGVLNTPFSVKGNISFSDFSVRYTPLKDGEKDIRNYIDGSFIRVWESQGGKNGKFSFDNIVFKNNPAYFVVYIDNSSNFTVSNCDFINCGRGSNSVLDDHSSIRGSADFVSILNCKYHSDVPEGGTFIELHGTECVVTGNSGHHCSTFINACGDINGVETNYIITNNLSMSQRFTNAWVYDDRIIDNMIVSNNIFNVYVVEGSSEGLFRNSLQTYEGDIKNLIPVDSLLLENNISTTVNYEDVKNKTFGDAESSYLFIMTNFVRDINIKNNLFNDIRKTPISIGRSGGAVGGYYTRDVSITDNKLNNAAWGYPKETVSYAYRTGIYFFIPPLGDLPPPSKVLITNNSIELGSKEPSVSNSAIVGIYINSRFGENKRYYDSIFKIMDNTVFNCTRDFVIVNQLTDGLLEDTFFIRHTLNRDIVDGGEIEDIFLGYNQSLLGLRVGSTVEIPNENIVLRKNIQSSWNAVTYGTSSPSELYWRRGSICYNLVPSADGYIGWSCVETGSPGTWKPFGKIEV